MNRHIMSLEEFLIFVIESNWLIQKQIAYALGRESITNSMISQNIMRARQGRCFSSDFSYTVVQMSDKLSSSLCDGRSAYFVRQKIERLIESYNLSETQAMILKNVMLETKNVRIDSIYQLRSSLADFISCLENREAKSPISFKQGNANTLDDSIDKTIFLSYCSFDSDLVDILDAFLAKQTNIKVSRFTRDVEYKESFKDFMKSLRSHDYVINFVSDHYLKSRACMFEVGELLKEQEFKRKLIFIIISENDERFYKKKPLSPFAAKIYTPHDRISYLQFWENEFKQLEKNLDTIDSISAKLPLLGNLAEIGKIISQDISTFMDFLSDSRGLSFEEMYLDEFDSILSEVD